VVHDDTRQREAHGEYFRIEADDLYFLNDFPETGSEGYVGVQKDPFGSEEGSRSNVGRLFLLCYIYHENQFTILSLLFATPVTLY